MDKKNVVFLTVLAVATLLTAVVGTTFAYFTASTQAGTRTATTGIIQLGTNSVGTFNANVVSSEEIFGAFLPQQHILHLNMVHYALYLQCL